LITFAGDSDKKFAAKPENGLSALGRLTPCGEIASLSAKNGLLQGGAV